MVLSCGVDLHKSTCSLGVGQFFSGVPLLAQFYTDVNKRKSGNVRTPYQREMSKKAFLDAYASCAILHRSGEIANIVPTTVRYWLNNGLLTQAEIDAAYEAYQDRIRCGKHQCGYICK